jgi:hypothetical protein
MLVRQELVPEDVRRPLTTGGKWNGPAGWLCIKVQRDPGFVQKGVCGKGHQEMAWKVVVKK